MRRHILLVLLVLAAACAGNNVVPKEPCKVTYGSNGVVISQLKPDYARVYTGGEVRYNVEVTNLGEKQGTNIRVDCTDDSELGCPASPIFGGIPFTLNPPDITACIEGAIREDQTTVKAQRPTGEQPAYFKVKLSYDYTSGAWFDVALISEAQWRIRNQQGIKPVQSMYHSASPVSLEVTVPDSPVVYIPAGTNEFPVTVVLKNMVDGYAYAQTSAGEEDTVDSVTLTVPTTSKIQFISGCDVLTPFKCTLNNVAVTTEADNPKSRVVRMEISAAVSDEEIYKISAEAKYTYTVFYASPQGVEIRSEFAP